MLLLSLEQVCGKNHQAWEHSRSCGLGVKSPPQAQVLHRLVSGWWDSLRSYKMFGWRRWVLMAGLPASWLVMLWTGASTHQHGLRHGVCHPTVTVCVPRPVRQNKLLPSLLYLPQIWAQQCKVTSSSRWKIWMRLNTQNQHCPMSQRSYEKGENVLQILLNLSWHFGEHCTCKHCICSVLQEGEDRKGVCGEELCENWNLAGTWLLPIYRRVLQTTEPNGVGNMIHPLPKPRGRRA